MSEVDISLFNLLNLAIGTPQPGAVNFSALHVLLHAMLRHLDIRDVKTLWKDTPTGEVHPDASVGASQEQEGQPGIESQARVVCSSSLTPEADGQKLLSRIQTCEDGLSKAMMLIQELHDQKDNLKKEMKEEMKELHHLQKTPFTNLEKCCHRVDALEDTVSSLRDSFQKYPDPEELSQFVTWDVMQSTLLTKRENLQKDPLNSEVDPATSSPSSSSTHLVQDPGSPAAPGPTSVSTKEAPSVTRPETGLTAPKSTGSERYPETVEALRDVGKLKERFSKLEARVAALEKGKVDQTQLTHLRELIASKGSRDALKNLMDELNQQRAALDDLRSDREKLDSLEDMFMNIRRDREADSAPGNDESDSRASEELTQQMFFLRKSVQKLQEDVKQLKVKQASSEERAAGRDLQDQLDELRGRLEDTVQSLTSQLSEGAGSQGQGSERSAEESREELSLLFQHYEQLRDTVNQLLQQQTGDRAGPPNNMETVELVNTVQTKILQIQAECEKLHETTRCLHDDNRQKQSRIEELYRTTEELQDKKADKQMVETEMMKADKSEKVSRLQFDSATEELNTMFHELLNKVTGQEQDWHKVIDRLSTEMECKLNRIELDSVKKQLEDRWRNIQAKLQAQEAPEHEDAAAVRKQLVDRFHCLSCDRPVVMHTSGQHLVKLPSTAGFPSHRSMRPFTVYALEQLRQHYRSLKPGTIRHNSEVESCRTRELVHRTETLKGRETPRDRQVQDQDQDQDQDQRQNKNHKQKHDRISEMSDYTHLVSRSCGGSHTVTSAGQRRSGLQHLKPHVQPEGDAVIQSEVDIVGLDGHIYKGRLNAPASKNAETKLPTISTKEGKTKDKVKSSTSHKAAASPEIHQPLSAKSPQGSHSASSCSGRDWPVSALGCPSQSSVTAASATADGQAEPPAGDTQHQ